MGFVLFNQQTQSSPTNSTYFFRFMFSNLQTRCVRVCLIKLSQRIDVFLWFLFSFFFFFTQVQDPRRHTFYRWVVEFSGGEATIPTWGLGSALCLVRKVLPTARGSTAFTLICSHCFLFRPHNKLCWLRVVLFSHAALTHTYRFQTLSWTRCNDWKAKIRTMSLADQWKVVETWEEMEKKSCMVTCKGGDRVEAVIG